MYKNSTSAERKVLINSAKYFGKRDLFSAMFVLRPSTDHVCIFTSNKTFSDEI